MSIVFFLALVAGVWAGSTDYSNAVIKIQGPTNSAGIDLVFEGRDAIFQIDGRTENQFGTIPPPLNVTVSTDDNCDGLSTEYYACAKKDVDFTSTTSTIEICFAGANCKYEFRVPTLFTNDTVSLPRRMGIKVVAAGIPDIAFDPTDGFSPILLYEDPGNKATLKVVSASGVEGKNDKFVFKAELDKKLDSAIDLKWSTKPVQNSAVDGKDFVGVQPVTLSIQEGEKEFFVDIIDDNLQEAEESFEIEIEKTDNDYFKIDLLVYETDNVYGLFEEEKEGVTVWLEDNIVVEEGQGTANFKVMMSHPVDTEVTIPVQTFIPWGEDYPANVFPFPTQYDPASETVTFAASSHDQNSSLVGSVDITINNDDVQSPYTEFAGPAEVGLKISIPVEVSETYSVYNIETKKSEETLSIVDVENVTVSFTDFVSEERGSNSQWQFTASISHDVKMLGPTYGLPLFFGDINPEAGDANVHQASVNLYTSPEGCAASMPISNEHFYDVCWPTQGTGPTAFGCKGQECTLTASRRQGRGGSGGRGGRGGRGGSGGRGSNDYATVDRSRSRDDSVDGSRSRDDSVDRSRSRDDSVDRSRSRNEHRGRSSSDRRSRGRGLTSTPVFRDGPVPTYTKPMTSKDNGESVIFDNGATTDGIIAVEENFTVVLFDYGPNNPYGYSMLELGATFSGDNIVSAGSGQMLVATGQMRTGAPNAKITQSVQCRKGSFFEACDNSVADQHGLLEDPLGNDFVIRLSLSAGTSVDINVFYNISENGKHYTSGYVTFPPTLTSNSVQEVILHFDDDDIQSPSKNYTFSVLNATKAGTTEVIEVPSEPLEMRLDDDEGLTIRFENVDQSQGSVSEGSNVTIKAYLSNVLSVSSTFSYNLENFAAPTNANELVHLFLSDKGTFTVPSNQLEYTFTIETEDNNVQDTVPCVAGSTRTTCEHGIRSVDVAVDMAQATNDFAAIYTIMLNKKRQDQLVNTSAEILVTDQENPTYTYNATTEVNEGEQSSLVLNFSVPWRMDLVFTYSTEMGTAFNAAVSGGNQSIGEDDFATVQDEQLTVTQMQSSFDIDTKVQNDDVQEFWEEYSFKLADFKMELKNGDMVDAGLACDGPNSCADPIIRINDDESLVFFIENNGFDEPTTSSALEIQKFGLSNQQSSSPQFASYITFQYTGVATSDVTAVGAGTCGNEANYVSIASQTVSHPPPGEGIQLTVCNDGVINDDVLFNFTVDAFEDATRPDVTTYLRERITFEGNTKQQTIRNTDQGTISFIAPTEIDDDVATTGKRTVTFELQLDKKLKVGTKATVEYKTEASSSTPNAPITATNDDFGMYFSASGTVEFTQDGADLPKTSFEIETLNDGCVYGMNTEYFVDISLDNPTPSTVSVSGKGLIKFMRNNNATIEIQDGFRATENAVTDVQAKLVYGCFGVGWHESNGQFSPAITLNTTLNNGQYVKDLGELKFLSAQRAPQSSTIALAAEPMFAPEVGPEYPVHIIGNQTGDSVGAYSITFGEGHIVNSEVAVVTVTPLLRTNELPYTFEFQVYMDRTSTENLEFDIEVDVGTAGDLLVSSAFPPNVQVPAGVNQTSFSIPTVNQLPPQTSASFKVTLKHPNLPAYLDLSNAEGEGVIQDDDVVFVVNILNGTGTEGGNCEFTVTPTAFVENELVINYTPKTIDSDEYTYAVVDKDYAGTAGQWKIPANSAPHEPIVFTIPIIDDNLNENVETFSVDVTTSASGVGLNKNQVFGTINDNDHATVHLEDADTVDEGDTLKFSVAMSHASSGQVSGKLNGLADSTVDCATQLQGGKPCQDMEHDFAFDVFVQQGQAGQEAPPADQVWEVATVNDLLVGPDEYTFKVAISNLVRNGASATGSVDLSCNQASCVSSGNIRNINPLEVDLHDASAVTEGSEMSFTIKLNGVTSVDLKFGYVCSFDSGNNVNVASSVSGIATVQTGTNEGTFSITTPDVAIVYSDDIVANCTIANNDPGAVTMTIKKDTATGTVNQLEETISCTDEHGTETGNPTLLFDVSVSAKINGDLEIGWESQSNGGCVSEVDAEKSVPPLVPDFKHASGTLSWRFASNNDGLTNKTAQVQVLNDDIQENEKRFDVVLTVAGPSGFGNRFTIKNCQGVLTDDEEVTIHVPDVTVTESVSGGKMYFPVGVSHTLEAPSTELNFNVGSSDAYNNPVTKVTVTGGRRKFAPIPCPPSNSKTACSVSLDVINDELVQPDRSFDVSFDSAVPNFIYKDAMTGQGTVQSDEDATITVEDVSGEEETSPTFLFRVQFSHFLAPGHNLSSHLHYATIDGSATSEANFQTKANVDYNSASGSILIDENTNSASFEVQVENDNLQEYDEHFFVNLTLSNDYYTLATPMPKGHIVNDTECPTIWISETSVKEDEDNQYGQIRFEVYMSHNWQTVVVPARRSAKPAPSIEVYTSPGTAQPGVDYESKRGLVRYSFSDVDVSQIGGVFQRFGVKLIADTLSEDDETFYANLDPSTASPMDHFCKPPVDPERISSVGTIRNDDGSVQLTLEGGRSFEGEKNAVFILKLSEVQPEDMHFHPRVYGCTDYYHCNGLATGRPPVGRSDHVLAEFAEHIIDYGAPPSKVTIRKGQTTVSISIPLIDDEIVEPTVEIFTLEVTGAEGNYVPTRPVSKNGTIEDNDYGHVTVHNSTAKDSDVHLSMEITLDKLVEAAVEIKTGFQGGSAQPGVDFIGDGNVNVELPTYHCADGSVESNAPCHLKFTLVQSDVVQPGAPASFDSKVLAVATGTPSLFPSTTYGQGARWRWPDDSDAAVKPTETAIKGQILRDGEDATIYIIDHQTEEGISTFNFPIYLSHKSTVATEVTLSMEGVLAARTGVAGMFYGSDYLPPASCSRVENGATCTVDIPASCEAANLAACADKSVPVQTDLAITIVDDQISESLNEELKITLEAVNKYPAYFSISENQASATLFIKDNDDAEIEINAASAVESSGVMHFPVTLSKVVDRPVVVSYSLIGVAAVTVADLGTDGAFGANSDAPVTVEDKTIYPDFKLADGMEFTFEAMTSDGLIDVTLYDDDVQECDEKFTASVTNVAPKGGTNYRVGKQSFPVEATGTIEQEDEGFYIYFDNNVTDSEADSPFAFSVKTSHMTSNPIQVTPKVLAGAFSQNRYNDFDGSITVPANVIAIETAEVDVINDFIVQPTGEMRVSFADLSSVKAEEYPGTCAYAVHQPPSDKHAGVGNIKDNEFATVMISDGSFNEGDLIRLPVTFSHDITSGVEVKTDWAGADLSGTLMFSSGAGANQEQYLTMQSTKTNCVDDPESFTYTLSNLVGGPDGHPVEDMSISDGTAVATVLNTDTASFKVTSPSEQSQDNGKYELTIDLDGCVDDTVVLQLTAEGVPSGSGIENLTPLNVYFDDNTQATVTILVGEGISTLDFVVKFELVAPKRFAQFIELADDYNGKYQYEKSDNGFISITTPGTIIAGESGDFSVELSGNAHKYDITYDYSTTDGSATAGADYQSVSGSGKFAPFDNTAHVYSVATIEGDVVTGLKDFHFVVANPKDERDDPVLFEGACEQTDEGRSCHVSASIESTVTTEVEFSAPEVDALAGESMNFGLEVSPHLVDFAFTAKLAYVDGSAVRGKNYEPSTSSITFDPFQKTKVFSVQTLNDNLVHESDLVFTCKISEITSSSPANANPVSRITAGSDASGVIKNSNVAKISFVESQVTFDGDSATFRLSMSHALSSGNVTVTFSTSSEDAEAGVDYNSLTQDVTWASGEKGEKTVVITRKVETWVAPEMAVIVSLSLKPIPSVELENDEGLATIPKQGSAAFTLDSGCCVSEGEVFTVRVKSVDTIRKGQPVVHLATDDIINVEEAAVAGVDYIPASGALRFAAENGLISSGTFSGPLEITTYPGGGGDFKVVVTDIAQDKNLVDITQESRELEKTVSIIKKEAIQTSSYNCAQPLRYVAGPNSDQAKIQLGFNSFPTIAGGWLMPIEVDVADCFHGDVTSYAATVNGSPVEMDGSKIELSAKSLNWDESSLSSPSDTISVLVHASTANMQSNPLNITVGIDFFNAFTIGDLQKSTVRLNVLDYWSGEVRGLRRDVFNRVNGLQCKFYMDLSDDDADAADKAGQVYGDVTCCERRGETVDIKSCFQGDADFSGFTGAQLQFQSVAAGRSDVCIGSSRDAQECFSVVSSDQLAMLAPIPDQYVVVGGEWTVEVDAVSTDMDATFEVHAPVEVTVTKNEENNKIVITSTEGQSGDQFSVSVVFTADKKVQRDTSNMLVETIGTTFEIFCL